MKLRLLMLVILAPMLAMAGYLGRPDAANTKRGFRNATDCPAISGFGA